MKQKEFFIILKGLSLKKIKLLYDSCKKNQRTCLGKDGDLQDDGDQHEYKGQGRDKEKKAEEELFTVEKDTSDDATRTDDFVETHQN